MDPLNWDGSGAFASRAQADGHVDACGHLTAEQKEAVLATSAEAADLELEGGEMVLLSNYIARLPPSGSGAQNPCLGPEKYSVYETTWMRTQVAGVDSLRMADATHCLGPVIR